MVPRKYRRRRRGAARCIFHAGAGRLGCVCEAADVADRERQHAQRARREAGEQAGPENDQKTDR